MEAAAVGNRVWAVSSRKAQERVPVFGRDGDVTPDQRCLPLKHGVSLTEYFSRTAEPITGSAVRISSKDHAYAAGYNHFSALLHAEFGVAPL